ncbi:RNA recognition motif domain-containing protein [Ditylenchus destructor]|nr:RNA recognition motif domain-containing protein [Ditylenchus destructor]
MKSIIFASIFALTLIQLSLQHDRCQQCLDHAERYAASEGLPGGRFNIDMNAKKSRSNIDEDQKAPKLFTADSSQKTLFRQALNALNSGPHTIEGAVVDVNRAVDDSPHIINGNPLRENETLRVNLCGRSINAALFVGSLPENVTEETLREEFSKYGKPVYWELRNDGKFDQSGPYGIVTYSSEQEASLLFG